MGEMLGVSSCHHGKMEDVAKQREKVKTLEEEEQTRQRKRVMIKEERTE